MNFTLYVDAEDFTEWPDFVKSLAMEGPSGRNQLIRAMIEAKKYREEATIESQKEAFTILEKAGRFVVDIGQGWYTVEYRGKKEWVQGASLVGLASQYGSKKTSKVVRSVGTSADTDAKRRARKTRAVTKTKKGKGRNKGR